MASIHEFFGVKVQLYRRPNSPFWWASASVGGQRHRKSTGKHLYEEAVVVGEEWAFGLKGVDHWGGGIKKRRRSFAEAAEQWISEAEILTRGERSPKYVAYNRARLANHLTPYFGAMAVEDIRSGQIDSYRIHRLKVGPLPNHRQAKATPTDGASTPPKRLGRSTLHQEIVCLRQVLKAEIRRGTIQHLPDMSMPHKLSGKVGHRAWFTPEEYKTLYAAARTRAASVRRNHREAYEELHDQILFLTNTGLRPDEALKIQLRDVSVEADDYSRARILSIEVRGKVGFGPCKSMPGAVKPFERLVARRRAELRSEGSPEAELPPSTHLFPRLLRQQLNNLLDELDLKEDREGSPRTFYSFRHTYICFRLLDGANPYELAKNCRTSIEMIQEHYAVHLKNYINTALVNVRRRKKKSSLKL